MTSNFISKRPHKKSRAGCQTCKFKKVKCDEAQPVCGYCALRKLKCRYTSKASDPATSEPSEPPLDSSAGLSEDEVTPLMITAPAVGLLPGCGGFSTHDLRMMHHYATFTYDSCVPSEGATQVLQFSLPHLAFEHDYLLNGMLGLASVHRQFLLPDDENSQKQTIIYRSKALSGYLKVLQNLPILVDSDFQSTLLMAIILTLSFSKDCDTKDEPFILKWFQLFQGLNTIFHVGRDKGRDHPQIIHSLVGPLFQRDLNELILAPTVPNVLLDMLASIPPDDVDYPHLATYASTLDLLGILYTSLRQDGLGVYFYTRLLSWLSRPTRWFKQLVDQKRPRALIMLLHYLGLLKLAKLWWIDGLPEREIPIMCNMIGPDWLVYYEVPRRIAQLTDDEEIVRLLLS